MQKYCQTKERVAREGEGEDEVVATLLLIDFEITWPKVQSEGSTKISSVRP